MAKATSAEITLGQVLQFQDAEGKLPKDSKTGSLTFYKKVRLMRKDATVKLARLFAFSPILSAKWSVETLEGAPEGAKELIEDCIISMQSHILSTALVGLHDFGWQAYEKIFDQVPYGMNAGKFRLRKLKPLLHDFTTIVVEENGTFAGLTNEVESKLVELDVETSLLLSKDVEGTNWYASSTMEAVEKPYDEWNVCNLTNVIYDKKIAGAHWVIWYPEGQSLFNGAMTDNGTIAKSILTSLENSGSFTLPSNSSTDIAGWKVEILSAYPTSNVAFIDRLKYLDSLKVRAFGLAERAVLEGQFGTKAEAESHADITMINMQLTRDMILQGVNWHVVNQLMRINWGEETEDTVRIVGAPIVDLSRQFLQKVYELILPNDTNSVDVDALRDKLGVPSIPDDMLAQQTADLLGAAENLL